MATNSKKIKRQESFVEKQLRGISYKETSKAEWILQEETKER